MDKNEIYRRKNLSMSVAERPIVYLQEKRLLNNYRISFRNLLTNIPKGQILQIQKSTQESEYAKCPTTRASRRTFLDAGCKTADNTSLRFNLAWGSPQKLSYYKRLVPGQIVNQIPGSNGLGRKDNLCNLIQQEVVRLEQQCIDSEFYKNIIPFTFILPHDKLALAEFYIKNKNHFLIYKPAMAARGNGIKFINNLDDLRTIDANKFAIVQEYIDPLLYHGYKFDCRVYVLVTSINPLIVYVSKEGLGRFSSHPYHDLTEENKNDLKMHLTNFSVNQKNGKIVELENGMPNKFKLPELLDKIEQENNLKKGTLFENIKTLVKATLIATESKYFTSGTQSQVLNVFPRRCYSLYGFDVLFTKNFEAKLLEVNSSPATATGDDLDVEVKFELLSNVLDIVGPSCAIIQDKPNDIQPNQIQKSTAKLYIPQMKSEDNDETEDQQQTEDEIINNNNIISKLKVKKSQQNEPQLIDQFDGSNMPPEQLYSMTIQDLFEKISESKNIDIKTLSKYEKLCLYQILDEQTRMGNLERVYPQGELHSQIYFKEKRYLNILMNILIRQGVKMDDLFQ